MKKDRNLKKCAGKQMLAAGGLGVGLALMLALGPVPSKVLAGLPVMVTKAAEPVVVSELTIHAVNGGIRAECTFAGFDPGSGYTMQLYLEKVNEDGSTNAITYKDLSPTADGAGNEQTTPWEVETGVYRAVLLMQTMSGGGNPIARFENSPLYDVVRNGENYEVTLNSNTGRRKADNSAEEEAEENSCSHQYSLQYDICREATPDTDALLAGKCVNCGEILSYEEVPNSAYVRFLQESADAIQKAAWGEQVMICTDRWISFDRRVAEALKDRPDVSVRLAYRYKGENFALEIPAGEAWNSLLDESGFCGFRYLDQLFGTERLETEYMEE